MPPSRSQRTGIAGAVGELLAIAHDRHFAFEHQQARIEFMSVLRVELARLHPAIDNFPIALLPQLALKIRPVHRLLPRGRRRFSAPALYHEGVPFRRSRYLAALPGSAARRCRSASMSEGVTSAIAERSLLCQPVTTSPSPRIIASKPCLATLAGSSFLLCPILVSSMLARSKKSVSVAPGIRQVTVTPEPLSSWRSANENESRNAFVPL